MSTRLKRKLGDLGVDTHSAKANESFCLIGTPLPPLEKSRDTGEFVPLWKQDVRDEKGRRRLHGAFTGGFSAGYFNSVGSKEGWTPSTFVSSRADRAKQKTAKPEDFMDEEDLQELKDGQSLVDTTDEMDLLGGTQAELNRRGGDPEEDSIASALEASMLPAPKDSAGARILKKMGWKIGQGIGPRVSYRQRKLQDLQASAGRTRILTSDEMKIPEDDEEASKHTYAPRDTPILLVSRKDNSHGLGYHPGMGLNESLGVKSGGAVSGPKLSAGFGLGALNDAEDDDVDVYDGSHFNPGRNRTAYDGTDREEDDTIVIGSRYERNRKPEADIRSTPSSSTQTFHDGKPVVPGFILSDKPVAEDRWFPLPDIPKGWTPDPRRVWDKDRASTGNKENATIQPPPAGLTHEKWKSSRISADQRGDILGETPLPSAPRSVFEYMSQKDRERLQNIASGGPPSHSAPAPTSSTPLPAPAPAPATITIPRTEPHIAQAALRGFQPFTTDPIKQSRYNAYLHSQATPNDPPPPPKPIPGQKIDEYNKELEDYAKAATIFKPISGAMAGRFTSAAIVDHGPKIHEGLHTPSAEDLREKEEQREKEAEERVTPKAHAARMGMYGPLTREEKSWTPNKLLCKRFGVKDPNPMPPPENSAEGGGASAPGADSGWGASEGVVPDLDRTSQSSGGGVGGSGGGRRDFSNVGLGEDETQGRDTLTYERPAMDIFKAIFASDDEESDDEDGAGVVGRDDPEDGARMDDPEVSAAANSIPTQDLPQKQLTITNGGPTQPQPDGPSSSSPGPAANIHDTHKIDLTTFKPTFIPREGKKTKDKDKDKPKKEKKKKEKEKEKRSILVSFEMDEDMAPSAPQEKRKDKDKDRPKKKRKEKRRDEDEDDEAMWVEKPPPDAVKDLDLEITHTQPPELADHDHSDAVARRGRKRAIDFM